MRIMVLHIVLKNSLAFFASVGLSDCSRYLFRKESISNRGLRGLLLNFSLLFGWYPEMQTEQETQIQKKAA